MQPLQAGGLPRSDPLEEAGSCLPPAHVRSTFLRRALGAPPFGPIGVNSGGIDALAVPVVRRCCDNAR